MTFIATLILVLSCVISVVNSWISLRTASRMRSVHSLQLEIVEIDACVRKLIQVVQRIEGKIGQRQKRDAQLSADQMSTNGTNDPLVDKADLRRYFGLIPGTPAKHTS
jgi:hypothetical protein